MTRRPSPNVAGNTQTFRCILRPGNMIITQSGSIADGSGFKKKAGKSPLRKPQRGRKKTKGESNG